MTDTSMGSMFVSFGVDLTNLKSGIAEAKDLLSGFGVAITGVTSSITSIGDVASSATSAIDDIGDVTSMASEKLIETSESSATFKDSIDQISSSLVQLGSNIGGVVAGRLSTFGSGIADIGIKIGNVVSGPINSFTSKIQNLSSVIGGVASSSFDALSSKVSDVASIVGGVASSAFDALSGRVQDIASSIGDAVSGPLNSFTSSVQDIASTVSDAASSALNSFASGVQNVASTVGDAVSGPLNAFTSGVQDIASRVGDAVSGPLNSFTSGVQDMASRVGDAVSGPFNAFISSIQSFGSDISEAASGPIADLINGIQNLSSSLSQAASGPMNSFKQSIADAGSGLGGMFQKVLGGEGNMSGLQSAFSGVVGGIQSFMGGIGDAASGVMDFASNLGFGIMNLQIIGQTAVSTAEQLLGPAASAETMQTAFETLMGSTQGATEEMQKLDAFASKTPFQTMDIDQAASQLIGFGINVNDVVPDLTAMGDALSAVGRGSAVNLDQIVNIFGKIQMSGKITLADMNQFSNDGVNAWAVLGRETGKTQAQLQAMISGGLLPAKDAMSLLTKGIEADPLYSGGMAKQSATMSGLISTLKSNWDQMMASFGSPILKGLEPVINNLGTALSGQGFKNFAGSVGQKVADAFKSIGDFVTKNDIGGKVQAIGKNLSQFFDNPDIKTFVKEVGGDLVIAFKAFMNAVSSPEFGTFMKDVGAFTAGALLDLYNGIKNVGQAVVNTTNFFKEHRTAMDALEAVLLATGIIIASILIPAFIGWAIAMGGVVIEALTLAAPFILVGAIIAAVIFGIILVVQHWSDIVKALQTAWGGLVDFFKNLMNNIVGAFESGINWLIDRIDGFISGINSISVAGFSVHIPLIPHLASGIENFTGGIALVGEQGPELVNLPRGANVLNASATAGMFKSPNYAAMSAGAQPVIHVHPEIHVHNDSPAPIYIDGKKLTDALGPHMANAIRIHGGIRTR